MLQHNRFGKIEMGTILWNDGMVKLIFCGENVPVKKTYFSESSVHFWRTFLVPQTDRVNQPEEVVPFRPKIDEQTKYLVTILMKTLL